MRRVEEGWRMLADVVTSRFDELHPSVQAERVVAKFVSETIRRRSDTYTTWLL